MTFQSLIFGTGYLVLFLTGFAAILYVRKRLQKRRPPLEFEHLRAPGESLSERATKLNERSSFELLLGFIFPLALILILLAGFHFFYPEAPAEFFLPALAITLILGTALSYIRLARVFSEISNTELGLKGERVVADVLRPLERSGFRVFHDIPASSNGKSFNLDHVVIGPTGLFLIETKTRRKGKAKNGRKDHVVIFDGKKLNWPWGSSTSELEQLKRQRVWLENWIHERTGKRVSAKPILAIPGWWTESTNPKARTRVLSHKNLCSAIQSNHPKELDDSTIDLLSRQLEVLCRTEA